MNYKTNETPTVNRATQWGIASVFLLGLLLRLYDLNRFSPWFDEALCIFKAKNLIPLLNGSGMANNPPLYFIFLHLWSQIATSVGFLRMLSVGFGMATLILVFWLGRIIWDSKTGLLAMLFLAVSPLHIYYSQEIKMYSMNCFLYVLTLILTKKLIENPCLKIAFVLGILFSLMLYTHYYLFLAVFTINLILVFSLKHKKCLYFANLVALACFAPWVPVYFKHHLPSTIGYVTLWIPKPWIKQLFYTFKNFIIGFHSVRWIYWPAVVLAIILMVAAIRSAISENIKIQGIFALSAPIPILTAFVISQWFPLYLDRYILFAMPMVVLTLFSAISAVPRIPRVMTLCLLFVLVICGLPNLYKSQIPYPWQIPGEQERLLIREMIQFFKREMKPSDTLFHISRRTLLSFEYEWPDRGEQKYWVPEQYENYPQPGFWSHSPLKADLIADHLKSGDRFWAILSNWTDDPEDPLIKHTQQWLGNRALRLRQVRDFSPVILEYYEWY